jgi:hypothetical protein
MGRRRRLLDKVQRRYLWYLEDQLPDPPTINTPQAAPRATPTLLLIRHGRKRRLRPRMRRSLRRLLRNAVPWLCSHHLSDLQDDVRRGLSDLPLKRRTPSTSPRHRQGPGDIPQFASRRDGLQSSADSELPGLRLFPPHNQRRIADRTRIPVPRRSCDWNLYRTSLTKKGDVENVDGIGEMTVDRTVEEMVDDYGLKEVLLSCGKLREMIIYGWARFHGWGEYERKRTKLDDVAD